MHTALNHSLQQQITTLVLGELNEHGFIYSIKQLWAADTAGLTHIHP